MCKVYYLEINISDQTKRKNSILGTPHDSTQMTTNHFGLNFYLMPLSAPVVLIIIWNPQPPYDHQTTEIWLG